ncbi:MAG: hypothetical protein HY864_01740 [Chloroflexi bacterium]|nr:hypothetical protein [Chloroflexota bacterium]
MNWQFSHDEENKTLILKTEGVLDIESANAMRREGWELIQQHGHLRCLLDHSDAEGVTLSTLDIYNLPKRYAELNIPHNFRMAVVVSSGLLNDMKFFETVCLNNGYFVSVFFDKESALAWLKN